MGKIIEPISQHSVRWTRLIPCKWEDSWLERVHGTGNTVVTTLSRSQSARLEVYCTQQQAEILLQRFGGKISQIQDSQWKGTLHGSSKPISIRGKLLIYQQTSPEILSSASESTQPPGGKTKRGTANLRATAANSQNKKIRGKQHDLASKKNQKIRTQNALNLPHTLYVPAEMAFGSGSHATTASCLRILCDLSEGFSPGWKMLDLGTGSGILAIAACALGAGQVFGVDFDPVAVRIARCNWRRNKLAVGKTQPPRFETADVLKKFPKGKYEVVCANLFSELLMKIAPRIFRVIKPGGSWIFSGVIAEQLPEVINAIERTGFVEITTRLRGKWAAGIAQKPH